MRSVYLLICIFAISKAFGQVTKEVDDKVFVEFPNSPEYSIQNGQGVYVTSNETCTFLVTVIRNALPMYDRFVTESKNWPKAEKEKVLGQFLDKAVESRTLNSSIKNSVEKTSIDGFLARKFSRNAINPVNGEKGIRHTTMVLVNDTVLSFDVWSMNEEFQCNQEKYSFFNSINITASEQR